MDLKYDLTVKEDFLPADSSSSAKSGSFTQILYVKSGSAKIATGDTSIQLDEGDSLIVPPFTAFDISDISKSHIECSSFSYFIHRGNFSFPKELALIHKNATDELSKILKDYFSLRIIDTDIDFLMKKALEYKILYFTEKAIEKSKRNIHSKLLPLISFIENNYSQNFTTADLARAANISESGVYKLFAAYSNKSPKQYIRECRLSHAVNLLLNSTKPIADIALETGFYDQFYFSKEFKKEFGVSPSEYRKLKKD